MTNALATEIRVRFASVFNQNPHLLVRSPGRINLIGEHTDYNGGFVLPAAIDREIIFAISAREDRVCRVVAFNLDKTENFSLDDLQKTEATWAHYLKGVIDQLQRRGCFLSGFNLVFGGNIPAGAGMSSSAALEAGLAFALNELYDLKIPRPELAEICQRAENEFVGLQCGIMDMFAALMGRADAAFRLDCRSLDFDYFPVHQDEYAIVLCNSGVSHSLADSEYNIRRRECETGLAVLQKHDPTLQYLREVTPELLQRYQPEFDPVIFRRCQYVVAENARVLAACEDLKNNDLQAFGQKMYASHEGLKNDYEVSCAELDFLVEQTRRFSPGTVLGARMMGGGFGGCSINLVKKAAAEDFIAAMTVAYRAAFDRELVCYNVHITSGTGLV